MHLLFFLFLFPVYSMALSMYPLTNQFKIGNDLSKVYEIRNDSTEVVAVEVSVLSREHIDGKEINKESEQVSKDFKIFPQSLIIKPNQMKAVRITYTGLKNIETEKAYRIIFTEKMIKDPLAKQKMKTLIEFRTSAFVAPQKSSSKVKILNYKIEKDFIVFSIVNEGNSHQTFDHASLKIKAGKKEFKFGNERKELMFNLLAGEKKTIKTKKPDDLDKITELEFIP